MWRWIELVELLFFFFRFACASESEYERSTGKNLLAVQFAVNLYWTAKSLSDCENGFEDGAKVILLFQKNDSTNKRDWQLIIFDG